MSFRVDLLLSLAAYWLLAVMSVSPGHAQVQALPAYAVGVEPLRQYDRGPVARIVNVTPVSAPRLPQIPKPVSLPDIAAEATQLVDMNVELPPPIRRECNSCSPASCEDYRTWQLMPDGLMYKSYLAGGRESRFAAIWFHEKDHGWLWDSVLGGRVGLFRYGTQSPVSPQGWQLDIEGAAFPRLDMENGRDLVSADFRFGVPLTSRKGPWETKFGYYHLSSHLGDEYMETHPSAQRINYARDCLVLGVALTPHPDLRLYAETAWAFYTSGGSRPWELQFGFDYSPLQPTTLCGTPFFAVNGRIREEIDYGGNFTVQTGWQWRGESGHLFRLGMHYFNGMSDQYQFFDQFEEHIGVALWYDY